MAFWQPTIEQGEEQPRFLLCDDTGLITNGDFETDTTGWSAGIRESDPATPFGDYVLKLAATSSTVTCDYGSAIGGKTFVVTFFARSTVAGSTVRVGAEDFNVTELSSSVYAQRAIVKSFPSYRGTTTFDVRFTTAGDLFLDNVECYEVGQDISALAVATYEDTKFLREVRPSEIMAPGGAIRVGAIRIGWRFGSFLKWAEVTSAESDLIDAINGADIVIVQPHTDIQFWATCVPTDSSYMRQFFRHDWLGLRLGIMLAGTELLDEETVSTEGS